MILSLSSDTHNLKIQAEGTVESDMVKNEICEVMECGVEAFKTRAKRYATINKLIILAALCHQNLRAFCLALNRHLSIVNCQLKRSRPLIFWR